MVVQSLGGLPAFLIYFVVASVLVGAYLFVYTWITTHDEFKLVRENNPAAAISLGLSMSSASRCRYVIDRPCRQRHRHGDLGHHRADRADRRLLLARMAVARPDRADREGGGRARDPARHRLGDGRHAQRGLDGDLTVETFKPSRAGADGRHRHDRGRRPHDAAAAPSAVRRRRKAQRRAPRAESADCGGRTRAAELAGRLRAAPLLLVGELALELVVLLQQ